MNTLAISMMIEAPIAGEYPSADVPPLALVRPIMLPASASAASTKLSQPSQAAANTLRTAAVPIATSSNAAMHPNAPGMISPFCRSKRALVRDGSVSPPCLETNTSALRVIPSSDAIAAMPAPAARTIIPSGLCRSRAWSMRPSVAANQSVSALPSTVSAVWVRTPLRWPVRYAAIWAALELLLSVSLAANTAPSRTTTAAIPTAPPSWTKRRLIIRTSKG